MDSVELTPANEQFIDAQVALGRYSDRSELVNAAIDRLKASSELQAAIDEGVTDLSAGRSTCYDESSLGELFARLKQRASSQPIS